MITEGTELGTRGRDEDHERKVGGMVRHVRNATVRIERGYFLFLFFSHLFLMRLRIWAMYKRKVDESMWDVWKWVEMRRGGMGWVNFKLSHWRSSPIHNKDNHNHIYTHAYFLPFLLYNYKIPHPFTSLLFFPPGVSQNVYQPACFNIWFRVKKCDHDTYTCIPLLPMISYQE